MTSLADRAGIDLQWAADGSLKFAANLIVDETLSRPRERLRAVALEPDSCEPADQIQYWMYNGISEATDRQRLAATGMRYELTLMFPSALGRERAKTLGHLHSFPPNSKFNYPEICEVLHGTAYFVFQSMNTEDKTASFCAILEAHPGDKVIIPPNLHHLTINAGDEPLLFSDVIPLDVKGIYQPLAEMRGAAYLYTLDEGWIRNLVYRSVPSFERWQSRSYPELSLTPDVPLYRVFSQTPELLSWMLTPGRFGDMFPDLWPVVETTLL